MMMEVVTMMMMVTMVRDDIDDDADEGPLSGVPSVWLIFPQLIHPG